jgi:hypothetical protein
MEGGLWAHAVDSGSDNKIGRLLGFAGIVFNPFTAITDTDLKERGALVVVFVTIWLLICRFHLRQSWKNYRNKLLKGKDPAKIDLKNRLKRLEDERVETQSIAEARRLLATEKNTLLLLGNSKPVRRALRHVKYLDEYWTTDNLWKSWSNYGRKVAATLLGCPMDGVIPTTNHLESFNGVLKRKHLRRWQNGGRRLRADVLIRILITHILPSIFQERRLYREQRERLAAQIRRLPGRQSLLQQQISGQRTPAIPSIAYMTPDQERHQRAATIIDQRQISAPTLLADKSGLVFTCYSSEALEVDSNPVQYTITILFSGVATCKCLDFRKHGGACKHLRAALIVLDSLRSRMNIPAIPIPQSWAEAHALENEMSILPEPSELPTQKAAAAVTDLLANDESCHATGQDSEEDDHGDDKSDNNSVATNESSDSEEDNDDDEDNDEPETSQVPQMSSSLQ